MGLHLVKLRAFNGHSYPFLELDFAEGTTCITGDNGSGKSDTGRLVIYTLTGQFIHPDIARSPNTLVRPGDATRYSRMGIEIPRTKRPRNAVGATPEPTITELTFTADGQTWVATRGISDDATTGLVLSSGEERYEGETAQILILNLAGVTSGGLSLNDRVKLFIRTHWVGVGQRQSFLNATSKERKQMLEMANPLSVLSTLHQEALRRLNETGKTLGEIRRQISEAEGGLKAHASSLLAKLPAAAIDAEDQAKHLPGAPAREPGGEDEASAREAEALRHEERVAELSKKILAEAPLDAQAIEGERLKLTEEALRIKGGIEKGRVLEEVKASLTPLTADLQTLGEQAEHEHALSKLRREEESFLEREARRTELLAKRTGLGEEITRLGRELPRLADRAREIKAARESLAEADTGVDVLTEGFEEAGLDASRLKSAREEVRAGRAGRGEPKTSPLQIPGIVCRKFDELVSEIGEAGFPEGLKKKPEAEIEARGRAVGESLAVIKDARGKREEAEREAVRLEGSVRAKEENLSRIEAEKARMEAASERGFEIAERAREALSILTPALSGAAGAGDDASPLSSRTFDGILAVAEPFFAALDPEALRRDVARYASLSSEIDSARAAMAEVGERNVARRAEWQSLSKDLGALEKTLSLLDEGKTEGVCDHCGGEIKPDGMARHKASIATQIAEKKSELESRGRSLGALEKEAAALSSSLNALETEKLSLERRLKATSERSAEAARLALPIAESEAARAGVDSAKEALQKERDALLEIKGRLAVLRETSSEEKAAALEAEEKALLLSLAEARGENARTTTLVEKIEATALRYLDLRLSIEDAIGAEAKTVSAEEGEVSARLEAAETQLRKVEAECAEAQTSETALAEIRGRIQKIEEILSSIAKKKGEIATIEARSRAIEEELSAMPADTPARLEEISRELHDLSAKADLARAEGELRRTAGEFLSMKSHLEALREMAIELEMDVHTYTLHKGLLAPNGAARTMAIMNDGAIVVRNTNERLEQISPDEQISVDLVLEEDEDGEPAFELIPEVNGQSSNTILPSGAQRNLIGLALDIEVRKLMAKDGFLIVDEPEAGLDNKMKVKASPFIRGLAPQTIVMTNLASDGYDHIVTTEQLRQQSPRFTEADFICPFPKKAPKKAKKGGEAEEGGEAPEPKRQSVRDAMKNGKITVPGGGSGDKGSL